MASGNEEPIDDAKVNKNNAVSHIEVKLHHDAQNGNKVTTSQDIPA